MTYMSIWITIFFFFVLFLHIFGHKYAYDFDKEMVIIENDLTPDKDVRNQDTVVIQIYIIQTIVEVVSVLI